MASFSKQLDSSFIDHNTYNTIPHINLEDVGTQEEELSSHREALLNVISNHKMDDMFSIHLLHRHYDLKPNHVMLYEQSTNTELSDSPFFEICSPRSIDKLHTKTATRGKFFFYRPEIATMCAYEYTTEPGPNLSSNEIGTFISSFISKLTSLKMEGIFALEVALPMEKRRSLYEIEIPQYNATVRVEKSNWVPDGFNTDWYRIPSNVEGIYNNNERSLREASSGTKKHAVSQRTQHSAIGFIEPPSDQTSLMITCDKEQLHKNSEGFATIHKARELIISG